jgi:cell division protein FtsB
MRKTDNPLWKQAATPEERREIDRLDRELAKLKKQSRKLSSERNFIANRCTVRARYEQRQAGIAAMDAAR